MPKTPNVKYEMRIIKRIAKIHRLLKKISEK